MRQRLNLDDFYDLGNPTIAGLRQGLWGVIKENYLKSKRLKNLSQTMVNMPDPIGMPAFDYLLIFRIAIVI
jgi:hypothetical protein